MREIEVAKPLVTFAWFFVGTSVLATIGAEVPRLSQHVGDILQEQIAGKTIIAFSGVAVFLAYLCAWRNILKPADYGRYIAHLIIDPTNFMVTLACVAAAVSWGVTLSSYFLFPLVARGELFEVAVQNAIDISLISGLLGSLVWLLHYQPADSKTAKPFGSPGKAFFWVAFLASTIFFVSFTGRLVFLALYS